MNSFFRTVGCLSVFVLTFATAHGANLDKARDAYRSKDYLASAKLFEEFAQQGDAEAQYRVGSQYDLGEGVPANLNEALKWYRLSAKQNFAKAQTRLGQVYQLGRGVPKDVKVAAEWYRKAAHRNDPEAQQALGQLYVSGSGVSKDYGQAATWLLRAARQGEVEAQSVLGELYAEGKGVRKNYVQAYFWKSLAGTAHQKSEPDDSLGKGLAEARRQMNLQARDDLTHKMTRAEIDQAQKLISKWRPKSERQM